MVAASRAWAAHSSNRRFVTLANIAITATLGYVTFFSDRIVPCISFRAEDEDIRGN